MSTKGLSLVVPVYNERDGIGGTIAELERLLKDVDFPFEVLMVDDGSSDGTGEVIDGLIAGDSQIKVIKHPRNRGYGAALKTGIRASQYDYIAITDADRTYPNERIAEFYKRTRETDLDMLVGARVGANANIPLIRRPAKRTLNLLANYLAEYPIPDLNSGMRIMRKTVIERFVNILPEGFSFTTTITLAMLTNGYAVEYEPIAYHHRAGSSKIRPVYDTLNFVQLIVRTTMLFRPLKVFLPMSLALFAVSILMLLYRVFVDQAFSVSATIFFIGAVQLLAIGMVADLIDRKLDR